VGSILENIDDMGAYRHHLMDYINNGALLRFDRSTTEGL
jgi:hypothetical protein